MPVFDEISAADESMVENEESRSEAETDEEARVCSADGIINGEKLNFLAMAAAGVLATKLTARQRTVLSLFLATVSTALANIAFADESIRREAERQQDRKKTGGSRKSAGPGC